MDWREEFLPEVTFLMPSRFEPCSSSTLRHALRVSPDRPQNRGLADTIDHFSHSSGSANGFLFEKRTRKASRWLFTGQSSF